MAEKKDLLEMDFGQVSVPQAVALCMQAATKCVSGTCDEQENVYLETDDERLRELMEKLEARIQDEIDEAGKANLPTGEDAPDEEAVEWSDVVLIGDDAVIANVKGVIYVKLCNEIVYPEGEGIPPTSCIKKWGHAMPAHEDDYGNSRFFDG